MSFIRKIPLAVKLLFDSSVSVTKKLWILCPILYLLSPIDLIPDPVLGFGIIDDFVLISFFINKISEILTNYEIHNNIRNKRKNFKGKIIEDVEYEIKDSDE